MCMKSHQLYALGQSMPGALPMAKGKRKGRAESEKNLRQTSHENQGNREAADPPNTQKNISLHILILYCGLGPKRKKKNSLCTCKRSLIIETNSGVTRASTFSNRVCIVHFILCIITVELLPKSCVLLFFITTIPTLCSIIHSMLMAAF